VTRVLLGRGKHGDRERRRQFKLGIYASDDPYGHAFSNALKVLVEAERPGAIVEQVLPRREGAARAVRLQRRP